jgi:Tfp pilus assembly pilus retraction ATPase PilT
MTMDASEHLVRQKSPQDHITDWYLPEKNFARGFIYPGGVPIGDHALLIEAAKGLIEICKEKTSGGYDEFVVKYNDRAYRGHKIDTIEGYVYALRRLPDQIPTLEALGMDPAIRQVLLDSWLGRGGLVIICGETGQGKSTTCAAMVKERMVQHGSFCLTVEDPPEMPLHGNHGEKGRCLQTEVKSGDFAAAMRGAMRCYPSVNGSLLYVGETRDSETAAEVLRIATNGHLVLTTLHAQDVTSAMKRFVGLAGDKMNSDEVRGILASAFRVIIHQTLETQRARNGEHARKKLLIDFLLSHGSSSPVAQKIRQSGADGLENDRIMQKNTLQAQGVRGLLSLWK